MENEEMEEAHLEELHRLYYNLQHRILPGIILSEQADELLKPNPAGEGLLSEAGTTEPAHLIEKSIIKDDLEKHIAEQEEKRSELDAFDFYDEVPDFLRDTDPDDFKVTDENFFEDDDPFAADEDITDEDFFEDDDEYKDDLFENETDSEEDENPDMTQFMAELEKMLELSSVKGSNTNTDENFLDDTWREAWFETVFEQIPDRAGYTLKRINREGYEIVLFTFPEPIQVVDAYMAAAIRKPGELYRYYTLEATVSEDEDTAVLAEWKANGVHRNSGSRTTDVKNTEALLDMIFEDLNYSY